MRDRVTYDEALRAIMNDFIDQEERLIMEGPKLPYLVSVSLSAAQVRNLAKVQPELEASLRQQCPSAFEEVVTLSPTYDGDSSFEDEGCNEVVMREFDGPYKGKGLHLDSRYIWRVWDHPTLGSTLVAYRTL